MSFLPGEYYTHLCKSHLTVASVVPRTTSLKDHSMVRDEMLKKKKNTLKICLWNRRKKVNDDFVALCSASAFHLLNAGGLGNCHAEVVSEVTWLLDVTGDSGDETSFFI